MTIVKLLNKNGETVHEELGGFSYDHGYWIRIFDLSLLTKDNDIYIIRDPSEEDEIVKVTEIIEGNLKSDGWMVCFR